MFKKPKPAHSAPPTQLHLNVRTFIGNVLVADDGTLARVLEIEPADLTMADPDEAAFVRSQFGQFISSIRFPDAIQFVMATYPQNLKAYLDRMRGMLAQRLRGAEAMRETQPVQAGREERLGRRLERWIGFIEFALTDVRPIENRYFAVVFHNPFVSLARGQKREMTVQVFDKAATVLHRKLAHVLGGLDHAGLKWRLLEAEEAADVIYAFYHPVCSPLADQTPPRLRLMPSLVATGNGWTPNRSSRGDDGDASPSQPGAAG